MKWYFASRTRHQNSIDNIVDFLKTQNESIVFEWSKLGVLTPFKENFEQSARIAEQISSALKEAEIFVLISDEAGTDMFIELGIALGNWLQNKKVKIYAIGKFNDRSLMHFHPAIRQVEKLSDVFKIENPNLLGQPGAEVIINFDPHA